MEAVLSKEKDWAMSSTMLHPDRTEIIDFTKPFIPETLTPLYHTEIYGSLSDEQKLCYNQLHGLYFNEQTMFFEKSFARTLLQELIAQSTCPKVVREGLIQFMLEEEQHTEM